MKCWWHFLIVTMPVIKMIEGALLDMCLCLVGEQLHGVQRNNQWFLYQLLRQIHSCSLLCLPGSVDEKSA
jgi:hypothetical protein